VGINNLGRHLPANTSEIDKRDFTPLVFYIIQHQKRFGFVSIKWKYDWDVIDGFSNYF